MGDASVYPPPLLNGPRVTIVHVEAPERHGVRLNRDVGLRQPEATVLVAVMDLRPIGEGFERFVFAQLEGQALRRELPSENERAAASRELRETSARRSSEPA